jgi:amino acid adenylation domain-containing protein/non-ribosomal peptide synthase protein (TIGR01720 family)
MPNSNIKFTSNQYVDHISFWTKQLSQISENFEFDGPKGKSNSSVAAPPVTVSVLTKESSTILRKISKGRDLELFVLTFTAVSICLSRYTNRKIIVIDSPTFDTGSDELQFPNIPLVVPIQNHISIRQFIVGINQVIQDSYKYQDYPLTYLPEDSGKFSTNAFIQFDAIHGSRREKSSHDIRFYLTRNQVNPDAPVELSFSYNAAAFSIEFLEGIPDHLNNIIATFREVDTLLGKIEMLTPRDHIKLLEEYTSTVEDYAISQPVHELIRLQSLAHPDRCAVVFGDRQLSYGALEEQSSQLGHYLRDHCGVKRGDVVGILLSRSEQYIISIVGILKSGAAYLPLDVEHPEFRLEQMVHDAGATVLITESSHLFKVPQYKGVLLALDIQQEEIVSRKGPVSNINEVNDTAYVIYTSGSTGHPKGVVISHSNVLNTQYWRKGYYGFDSSYVTLQLASFSFDSSVNDIFSMLLWGGSLVVLNESERLEGSIIRDKIMDYGVTNFNAVPSLYRHILEHLDERMHSLRVITIAGEKVSTGLVGEHFRILPLVMLINEYGPTENSICTSAHKLTGVEEGQDIPIGRPISNTAVYILGEEQQLLPPGVWGEICVSGSGLSSGYLGLPGSGKFIAHPFKAGAQLYRTGDIGRWRLTGELEYQGRSDDQIKLRGYRIELGEISTVLEQAPGVEQALVLAQGEEQKRLVGYVVGGEEFSIASVRSYLLGRLPEYMIPQEYVKLSSMPLTGHGKIDRSRLLLLGGSSQESVSTYVAPVTAEEQLVSEIWSSILGLDKISVEEDFFTLGGDSIKAIQIASRLYKRGYKASVKDIFEYPQIRTLSGMLRPLERLADQGAVAGSLPLTPIQHYFFNTSRPSVHHYNQSVMLYWPQGIEKKIVEQIFNALVHHHDALRLRYQEQQEGVWHQYHGPVQGVAVEEYDYRGLGQAPDLLTSCDQLQRSLNLTTGPMLRLGLFHLDQGSHLLIVMHHLIVDTVSWRILLEDLESLYEQLKTGVAPGLPPKTDSFKVWSQGLEAYRQQLVLSPQYDYWLALLKKCNQQFPRDYDRGANTLDSAQGLSFELDERQTHDLLKAVPQRYHTEINDILLTALSLSLYRFNGLTDVAVMLEGHGREDILENVDVSRTVGWFTSMYPVVMQLQPQQALGRQIKEIKELLHQFPHKGIGYGILKYGAAPSEKALPEVQVPISFNYLGQFDTDIAGKSFRLSTHGRGSEQDGSTLRDSLWDISGMVSEGKLWIGITYSRHHYDHAHMEEFISLYRNALQEIISHCMSRATSELTPSDLSYSEISISDLETFFN